MPVDVTTVNSRAHWNRADLSPQRGQMLRQERLHVEAQLNHCVNSKETEELEAVC